jgi:hypothetical protein
MSIQETSQIPVPSIARSLVEVTAGGQRLAPEADGAQLTYTTTVGVMLHLVAPSATHALSVTWTVEGMQYAVKGYTATLTTAQATPLTQADLGAATLDFAWWKPGHYTVTCTVSTTQGTVQSSDDYVVTAPLVKGFNWWTGVVGVGTYTGKTFLRLVRSMSDFDHDGMLMNAVVAGTQQAAGTLAGIQMASQQRFCTRDDGRNERLNLNGIWVLDSGMTNTVLYQGTTVALPANGANANYQANDGPGAELNENVISAMFVGDGDVTPTTPELYRMYLMFLPSLPNSVWVPLKVLMWGWEGMSAYEYEGWTPAQDPGIVHPVVTDPTGYPTWTQNTSQNTWIPW